MGISPIASPTAVPSPKTHGDCENPETGWKIEKLNGKVKSLQEYEIEYGYGDHKKEQTRLVTFKPDGSYIKVDERSFYTVRDYRKLPKPKFVFDGECRVTERTGSGESGTTRTVISYTPSGDVLQKAIYDLDGRLLWKSDATLDDKGRVIETNETIQVHPEHFNPKRYDIYRHTRSLYKFDDANNVAEQIDYKYDGTLYATYQRVYDTQHRLVRELWLDHKARPIDLVINKRNEAGVVEEELKYTSFEYGQVDELLPGKLDSGYGMFQHGRRIVYEFDKQNNWIKKTEFDLDEGPKLDHVTFRTILYY